MNLAASHRSLKRYTLYIAGSACDGWAPLFFLYMSARCSVTEVLMLEALYYMSVVCLEVPSGYFSDRTGIKPTLWLSATARLLAYITFATSSTLPGLACAQVLLATGISLNSGTDTNFRHAESVRAGGRVWRA